MPTSQDFVNAVNRANANANIHRIDEAIPQPGGDFVQLGPGNTGTTPQINPYGGAFGTVVNTITGGGGGGGGSSTNQSSLTNQTPIIINGQEIPVDNTIPASAYINTQGYQPGTYTSTGDFYPDIGAGNKFTPKGTTQGYADTSIPGYISVLTQNQASRAMSSPYAGGVLIRDAIPETSGSGSLKPTYQLSFAPSASGISIPQRVTAGASGFPTPMFARAQPITAEGTVRFFTRTVPAKVLNEFEITSKAYSDYLSNKLKKPFTKQITIPAKEVTLSLPYQSRGTLNYNPSTNVFFKGTSTVKIPAETKTTPTTIGTIPFLTGASFKLVGQTMTFPFQAAGSGYELATGRNLVTGEKLQRGEIGFKVLDVALLATPAFLKPIKFLSRASESVVPEFGLTRSELKTLAKAQAEGKFASSEYQNLKLKQIRYFEKAGDTAGIKVAQDLFQYPSSKGSLATYTRAFGIKVVPASMIKGNKVTIGEATANVLNRDQKLYGEYLKRSIALDKRAAELGLKTESVFGPSGPLKAGAFDITSKGQDAYSKILIGRAINNNDFISKGSGFFRMTTEESSGTGKMFGIRVTPANLKMSESGNVFAVEYLPRLNDRLGLPTGGYEFKLGKASIGVKKGRQSIERGQTFQISPVTGKPISRSMYNIKQQGRIGTIDLKKPIRKETLFSIQKQESRKVRSTLYKIQGYKKESTESNQLFKITNMKKVPVFVKAPGFGGIELPNVIGRTYNVEYYLTGKKYSVPPKRIPRASLFMGKEKVSDIIVLKDIDINVATKLSKDRKTVGVSGSIENPFVVKSLSTPIRGNRLIVPIGDIFPGAGPKQIQDFSYLKNAGTQLTLKRIASTAPPSNIIPLIPPKSARPFVANSIIIEAPKIVGGTGSFSFYAGTGAYEISTGGLRPGTLFNVPKYSTNSINTFHDNKVKSNVEYLKPSAVRVAALELQTSYIEKPSLNHRENILTKQFDNVIEDIRFREAQKINDRQIQRVNERLSIINKEASKARITELLINGPNIKPPRIPIPRIPIPRINPDLSESGMRFLKTKTSKFSQPVYIPQVRRGGKFFSVGKPTTRGRALLAGAIIAKKTLAATFRIVPTKGRTTQADISYTPNLRVFRAPKGKKEQPLTFVQRTGILEGAPVGSSGRLASFGERKEIIRARGARPRGLIKWFG